MPRKKRSIIEAQYYQKKPKEFDPSQPYTIQLYASTGRDIAPVSIGLRILPEFWDSNKRIIINCQEAERYNAILEEALTKINSQIKLKVESGEYPDKETLLKIFAEYNPKFLLRKLPLPGVPIKAGNIKFEEPDSLVVDSVTSTSIEEPASATITETEPGYHIPSTSSGKSSNERYWLDFTISDTIQYCKEMLLFTEENISEPRVKKIISKYMEEAHAINKHYGDYDKLPHNKKVEKQQKLEALFDSEMEIFRSLKTFLRNPPDPLEFKAFHLTKRLAVARDERRGISYEFLVEYDIYEPHVEIYYGIKAVSDASNSSDEFVEFEASIPKKFVSHLEEGSRKTSKSKGKLKAYIRRLKFTNNANDGTFWLVWARKQEDEKMVDVINALQKYMFNHFNDYYRKNFQELSLLQDDFSDTRVKLNRQLISPTSPLDNLIKEIKNKPKNIKGKLSEAEKANIKGRWNKVLENVENRINHYQQMGLLKPYIKDGREQTGEFVVDLPDKKALKLIEVIFNRENWEYKYEDDIDKQQGSNDRRVNIAQSYIVDLFHREDGTRFTEKEIREAQKMFTPREMMDFIESLS